MPSCSCMRLLLWFWCATAFLPALAAPTDIEVVSRAETYRGPKEARLLAKVHMPEGRVAADAVVIVNSSAGAADTVMGALASGATRVGIAAVLLDTYTPRGIADTITNQGHLTYFEQFADIFAVLEAMRADPRFQGRKIALAGHSRGAILAYMAAFTEFQTYYEEPAPLFDAYVGLSTDCLPTFQIPKLNAPLYLVSGQKDDWTPPGPCRRQIERLQKAQQPASMDIIAGANHSFSSNGVYLTGAIKFACPNERDYFYVRRERIGRPMRVLDPEHGVVETPYEQWRRCAGVFGFHGRGATGGGDRDQLPSAVNLAVQFLQSAGWR